MEELENTLSSTELQEWYEYYRLEPFLSDRLENQLAKIGYSNLFTGMSKIDLDYDYFLMSEYEKKEKEAKPKYEGLAEQIKATFGVK